MDDLWPVFLGICLSNPALAAACPGYPPQKYRGLWEAIKTRDRGGVAAEVRRLFGVETAPEQAVSVAIYGFMKAEGRKQAALREIRRLEALILGGCCPDEDLDWITAPKSRNDQ